MCYPTVYFPTITSVTGACELPLLSIKCFTADFRLCSLALWSLGINGIKTSVNVTFIAAALLLKTLQAGPASLLQVHEDTTGIVTVRIWGKEK